MSKNLRALSARRIEGQTLFEALSKAAQSNRGAPSPDDLRAIATERLVSPASLLGTVSFYDYTRATNQGVDAYVCTGTSCRLSGHAAQARAALTARDDVGAGGTA